MEKTEIPTLIHRVSNNPSSLKIPCLGWKIDDNEDDAGNDSSKTFLIRDFDKISINVITQDESYNRSNINL
jgi:hypothetical protein